MIVNVPVITCEVILASERSKRDTIRGNKWKSEIYIYILENKTFKNAKKDLGLP